MNGYTIFSLDLLGVKAIFSIQVLGDYAPTKSEKIIWSLTSVDRSAMVIISRWKFEFVNLAVLPLPLRIVFLKKAKTIRGLSGIM